MCCIRLIPLNIAMDSILVSTIVLCFISFFKIHQAEGTSFSVHEQLEIKEKIQNSTINTIITEDGDVYDCVNIYKQPSLDHPLLRNHTLKLKPSFTLDGVNVTDPGTNYLHLELENGGCTEGTIPIRRIETEDIEHLQAYLKNYPSSINPNSPDKPNWHFAMAQRQLRMAYRGARGSLNIYNPHVTKQQHSDATVYVSYGISDDHNAIHAGWSVFPAIYKDGATRLFTQWTVTWAYLTCAYTESDPRVQLWHIYSVFEWPSLDVIWADNYQKTGCVDILCKGFVQVNRGLPLGYRMKPLSTYEGPQFSIPISIVQDQMSGEWWLIASFSVFVGYWPKELFTGMSRYADEVGWGGRTYSPNPLTFPSMGSGHRPAEGDTKACYIQQMQYTLSGQASYEDPKISSFYKNVDFPNCYDLDLYVDYENRCNMDFGGPGGNCGRLV